MFPKPAKIFVPSSLSNTLNKAIAKLPLYDDKELYDFQLQTIIRDKINTVCTDGFNWLVNEIQTRLNTAPYCAYVVGIHFDKSNLLFLAITGAFGKVVDPYNQPWSRLVRKIQPSTDRTVDFWGVLNEQLHTDGTDWPQPNDLTCLLCVRPDQNGGGRSRLLDIDTLLTELKENFGTETIDLLHKEPVPWKIAEEIQESVFWEPVFTANNIRWLRYTIDIALKEKSIQLSETVSKAIADMQYMTENAKGIIDFSMESGNLLFINNKRSLHARTPINNPQSSKRLVLRTKILISK